MGSSLSCGEGFLGNFGKYRVILVAVEYPVRPAATV